MVSRHASPLRWSVARWIAVLCAVNVIWRLARYAIGFPIWGDEAFVAMSLVDRGLLELTTPLEYDQIAPILFLWAEWIATRTLGWSEWSLRLVPFLAGIGSVVLFVRLARAALPRHAALAAVAFFAAAYYPVRHAAELKPYSLDLLVALAVLLPALRLVRGSQRPRDFVALAAAGGIGVWASYPSVFVIGGVCTTLGVQWLRRRGAAPLGPLAATAAVIGVSFVTMFLLAGAGQSSESGADLTLSGHWADTFPAIREPWTLPTWFVRVHTGRMFAYPNGGPNGGSTATFLLFIVGCVALWKRERRLLGALLVPFALMFAAAALKKYPYGGSARVAQHVAPIICLLAGLGLTTILSMLLPGRAVVGGVRVVAIVFLVLTITGIVIDVRTPYKDEADRLERTLIRELAEAAEPNEQWIMFGTMDGDGRTVPNLSDWGGSSARWRYNVFRFAEPRVDVRWGPEPDAIELAPGARLRLMVQYGNWVPMPEGKLRRYLRALGRRIGAPARHDEFDMHNVEERIVVYTFIGTDG